MAYVEKNDWENTPSTNTPITAEELIRIEQGVTEGVNYATETRAGNVELASSVEMTAGSDLTRVPSVKRVTDYVASALSSRAPVIVLGAIDPIPAGTVNGTIVLRRYT